MGGGKSSFGVFEHSRFAIRNEFQDEVAWSLLCLPGARPHQHPGHLAALDSRAPHGPGATALSGHPTHPDAIVDVVHSNCQRELAVRRGKGVFLVYVRVRNLVVRHVA